MVSGTLVIQRVLEVLGSCLSARFSYIVSSRPRLILHLLHYLVLE